MLETHVTTLEQSRKLYELGFEIEPCFWWNTYKGKNPEIADYKMDKPLEELIWYESIPAYLLSEIMSFLPPTLNTHKNSYLNVCVNKSKRLVSYYSYNDKEVKTIELYAHENQVTAACDLLIWCIEQWFISVSKDD